MKRSLDSVRASFFYALKKKLVSNQNFISTNIMSENNYISIDKVLEKTSFGRSSLYAKIGEGLFPKPVKVGSRKIAWPEYEVNQVMAFYLRTTDEEERKIFVTNLEKVFCWTNLQTSMLCLYLCLCLCLCLSLVNLQTRCLFLVHIELLLKVAPGKH